MGRYPLVVDPIIDTKWLTKVLMDGGSGLNIMYAEMLNTMGIDWLRIWSIEVPFHGIVLGKQALPLKQIDLPITFENLTNYRMETLTFEHAYECEVKCCEHTMVIVASKELAAIREEIIEEAPNPKRSARCFEPMEGVKEVLIDPNNSEAKAVRIGTTLSSK
ncbi:uncharacterized protein [Miscanthus floridulus]|uniref:uncharacterized protein n=1 Tax=Miscanthus floridulus TaxID=154761 RepID=UPI0034598B47